MSEQLDFDGWVCPVPLRDHPQIVMGHGGGGKLSAELVEHLFLPAFGEAATGDMGDSAVLGVGNERLAFSTDSYVVRPLFFPGGNIGDLAINGTVNDLAMRGARPLFLWLYLRRRHGPRQTGGYCQGHGRGGTASRSATGYRRYQSG
jgi:hydrogenase expression/formation protein HypE